MTGERRKRLGFARPMKCVLCNKNEESVDHLLLNCDIAQQCWSMIQTKLEWYGPLLANIRQLFLGWPRINNSSLLSCIWDVCPSSVVWEIWKECNRQIFQDK